MKQFSISSRYISIIASTFESSCFFYKQDGGKTNTGKNVQLFQPGKALLFSVREAIINVSTWITSEISRRTGVSKASVVNICRHFDAYGTLHPFCQG